jgi:hypothetical protein
MVIVTVPLIVDQTDLSTTVAVSAPRTVMSLEIDTFPVNEVFPARVTVEPLDEASIASWTRK